jgi:hypothetical protein
MGVLSFGFSCPNALGTNIADAAAPAVATMKSRREMPP